MNSFYSDDELKSLGLKSYGSNVLISRKCCIYGTNKVEIGNNVRIDDFCIISGNVKIGDFVHIAAYCSLFAGDTGIIINDFCGLSSRCSLYAESDDYSGSYLTNPMIPMNYRNIIKGRIIMEKHSIIGTGSTVLPGVVLGEGSAIGSMSLVLKGTIPWSIYMGIPAKKFKEREKRILELESELLKQNKTE